MKIRHLFLVAAAALAALACQKEGNVPAGLSVDQTSVVIPSTGGSVSVKVSSSEAWTAAISEAGKEWLHVTPLQGQKGVTTLTITVSPITGKPRSARINFLAGLYNASVAVTQEGTEAAGDGLTLATAWTPSEARAWVLENLPKETDGKNLVGTGAQKYWIKGKVHKIYSKDGVEQNFKNNEQYGNATFFMSDDGQASKEDFEAYQINYLGNVRYVKDSQDPDVEVGSDVVIYGSLVNFNGTPETMGNGKAFMFSLNGVDRGGAVTKEDDPKGDGREIDPFNAAGVIQYIKSAQYKPEDKVFVYGKVSSVTYPYDVDHGTATFTISDDGSTTSTTFTCYSLLYFGGLSWIEGFDNVAVGDDVIICGKVKYYEAGAIYETETKEAWLVSLNGQTVAEDVLYVPEKEVIVASTATEVEISVLGTVTWNASVAPAPSTQGSATVTPDSGMGEGKVKVSFEPNTDQNNEKEYILTISTIQPVETSSFTVTIRQSKAAAEGAVVVSMDKEALAAAAFKGAKVSVDDVISFTNSSDYGTNTVTELRIYKNQILTISAVTGYKIIKVEFECAAAGDAKWGPGCFVATPDTYSYKDKYGTWEGSASSIAFTASTNQVRIVAMTITYVEE